MRVMTFNLRFENEFDGDNCWANRCEILLETIRKYSPHVLGTQEGKPSQLSYLSQHLQDYQISADWRYWDDNCQYPTLFFRRDHFLSVEGGEFWLSETPHVHLSKSWDSAFPRMLSYVLLEMRDNSQRVWCAVTHLDHISRLARVEGAKIIRDWSVNREEPIVLMGDFNDMPGSEVHKVLTLPDGPFVDTWQVLGREEDERSYTHHGFTGIPQKGRIDWILVVPEIVVVDAVVADENVEGRYPSDHFPYVAKLELSVTPGAEQP
ncbi:MAG: endonuclease/exonuclease/phosphatase family protein [Deltaproteobacteria bacterium]|nr:endonuclease/exonuclease/phosphatase family protein [Deltaproteobacteria bacterium]MBW2071135.1 endonuclease/exonuclease/phosphatase family protein [Deltaproteobacteria bacterium]